MPYSETAYKASQRYKAGNIKRVPLDMQKSTYEEIKAHAETRNETVNGFIKRSIFETMERDGAQDPQEAAEAAQRAGVSLPSETLETAQRAAEDAGEATEQFISRAVETQAHRDKVARGLKV